MREDLIKDIKRVIRIIIASLIIAANIKIFVNAGSLFPGGFTGVSILIQRSFDKFIGIKIPYSPVNIILNAIPAWVCFVEWIFVHKKNMAFFTFDSPLDSSFSYRIFCGERSRDVCLGRSFLFFPFGIDAGICFRRFDFRDCLNRHVPEQKVRQRNNRR